MFAQLTSLAVLPCACSGSGAPGAGAEDAFFKWATKCFDTHDGKDKTVTECGDLLHAVCGRKDVSCTSNGKVDFEDDSGAVVATGDTKTQRISYLTGSLAKCFKEPSGAIACA